VGEQRHSRTNRRKGRAVSTPTRRDLGVLHALGRMKLLSTRQIRTLFGWSQSTTNKRMRRLYDGGLASCFVPKLAGENVYGLARRGREALESSGFTAGGVNLQVMTRLGKTNLAHLGLVNDYWIWLATSVSDRTLIHFYPEAELRADSTSGLCPDAVFVLKDERGQAIYYALEADLGTEPARVLQGKIRKYQTAAISNYPVCEMPVQGVVFVTRTERRRAAIEELVRAAGARNLVYVTRMQSCEEF